MLSVGKYEELWFLPPWYKLFGFWLGSQGGYFKAITGQAERSCLLPSQCGWQMRFWCQPPPAAMKYPKKNCWFDLGGGIFSASSYHPECRLLWQPRLPLGPSPSAPRGLPSRWMLLPGTSNPPSPNPHDGTTFSVVYTKSWVSRAVLCWGALFMQPHLGFVQLYGNTSLILCFWMGRICSHVLRKCFYHFRIIMHKDQ